MMYPLKFNRHLVKKIWGGRTLEKVLGIKLPENENYGESWEISSHPNGMTFVANGVLKGKSLEALLNEYKEELVGQEIYEKYGNKFPLLFKFLDINDKLSVQVHPDNEYSSKNEGELGKGECWYILEASDDAKLILGTKFGVTKDFFEKKVKNNDFEGLFNEISVKSGDLINIKPGLIHASLEGSILIYETQQNSDITYRIYDFDRLEEGQNRTLHLDKAVEVIDFNATPDIIRAEKIKAIKIKNTEIKKLLKEDYFSLDKISIVDKYTDYTDKNFKVFSVLRGFGTLQCGNISYELKKSDMYLIPANLEVSIEGNLSILKVYI